MSRVVEEAKAHKNGKNGKSSTERQVRRFLSFHPTKDQKEYLRTQDEGLDDLLVGIRPYLEDGHKITIGYSEKNKACYASIRENHQDWQQARAISAWHADADMALRSLCYAIVSQYPSFPDFTVDEETFDLNW